MFRQIAVIGAGTMGSGIAAQVANAGHPVLLLDMPGEDSPNALAEAAVDRLLHGEPPQLVHPDRAGLIRCGNVRDDFQALAGCDWIVEAIVERLPLKQDLYARLEGVIDDDCIVTSNTSTIPISLLTEGRSASFRRRFAITHYFNPVRYMRLLELVQGTDTAADVMDRLADMNDRELGKGVVRCADTPGFLGNRVGVFALQVGIDEAMRNGLDIEVADALMGRPMGIPKTGVFGLYDLIGIDLMVDVVRSLVSILPPDDPFQPVGADNPLIGGMLAKGLRGNKSGAGFYRRRDGSDEAIDLDSGDYRPRRETTPMRAREAERAIAAGEEPLPDLLAGEDAEARFCQRVLARVLGYAASLLGEVTDSPQAIDDAMKLGFNWVRGPFEMIDALGSATVRSLLQAADQPVPAALQGDEPFYRVATDLQVRHANGNWHAIDLPEGAMRFHLLKRTLDPLLRNRAASLYRLPGDLRLIEFHSKANALTADSMAVVAQAARDHGRGIIVHNDAQHYSAGVDLNAFLAMIRTADWVGIDAFLADFQAAVSALRQAPVPVVGAPSGLSLGGGMEVLLHCDALVVHSNSVLGLVESAVGLLPSGGGVRESLRRWHQAGHDWDDAAWRAWKQIGYGATGSSPRLAEGLCYYRPGIDTEVINRDRLLGKAIERVQALADGYAPPQPAVLRLGGQALRDRMQAFMDEGVARGDFLPHDRVVAMGIASVLCADDGAETDVPEEVLYARERAAFVRLAQTPQTQARIEHLLGGKGTLRN